VNSSSISNESKIKGTKFSEKILQLIEDFNKLIETNKLQNFCSTLKLNGIFY